MEDLRRLATLVKQYNALKTEVTEFINRPATLDDFGEYLAGDIFNISFDPPASHRRGFGRFTAEPLLDCSVQLYCYSSQRDVLDITSEKFPHFYLVMTGPRTGGVLTRGQIQVWSIRSVFLFKAWSLLNYLQGQRAKIGMATTIPQKLWQEAEIYPRQMNELLVLSPEQRQKLSLFR